MLWWLIYKIEHCLFGSAGPPDTMYLYYLHVEGIALQGSFSPACINQFQPALDYVRLRQNRAVNFILLNFATFDLFFYIYI